MSKSVTIDPGDLMDVAGELIRLHSLAGLAALASETVRVLDGVNRVCSHAPEFDEALDSVIDARNEWMEYSRLPITTTMGWVSRRLLELGNRLDVLAIKGADTR